MWAGQTTVEGYILFDQRCFIIQELANQLQIQQINHEQISVWSFGEQVLAFKRLAYCIYTYLNYKQGLHTHIWSNCFKTCVRTHLDQLPYLQGLSLAHPVTSDEIFTFPSWLELTSIGNLAKTELLVVRDQLLSSQDWAIFYQAHYHFLIQLT